MSRQPPDYRIRSGLGDACLRIFEIAERSLFENSKPRVVHQIMLFCHEFLSCYAPTDRPTERQKPPTVDRNRCGKARLLNLIL